MSQLSQLYWLVKEELEKLVGPTVYVENATQSKPIKITTLYTNPFVTGQHIRIDKVKGNTAANGNFYLKVLDNIHFELYGQLNAVTSATNTTPIIATVPQHNFNTGDKIEVLSATGNTAVNGFFYVKQQGTVITSISGTPIITVTGFSNTNPIVISATSHGLVTNDRVQIVSPVDVASINGVFYVNVLTANTYEIYTDAALSIGVDGTVVGVFENDMTMQKYSPLVVTSNSHGFSNKSAIKIIDVSGESAANGGFYAGNITTNTFALYSDAAATIPVLATATYSGGGITALLNNYNLELYTPDPSNLLSPFSIPSVGNGVYTGNGIILSRPIIGNATYVSGGEVVKNIGISNDFKGAFPNVPANVFESIVKRIRT